MVGAPGDRLSRDPVASLRHVLRNAQRAVREAISPWGTGPADWFTGTSCSSWSPPVTSVAGHAAVDGEGGAGDVGGGGAGQEHDGGVEFVLQAEPAERAVLLHEGQQDVFRDLGRHLAGEVAGRDGVDPDSAPAGPLLGEVAGEAQDAGLARGVGGLRA